MANVFWKTGQTGNWETAADWSTGAVPGALDTAIIAAPGSYSVDVTVPVGLAALTLSGRGATLDVSSVLDVGSLTLRHGILKMDGGTLAGDVTDTGSPVYLTGSSTWDDVTWHGNLKAGNLNPYGTLTLLNGFTLTRPSGSSPGTAVIQSAVVLDNTTELDNANLSIGDGLSVAGASALTLGTNLTLTANLVGNDVTNNGTLYGSVEAGTGTYTNNGFLSSAMGPKNSYYGGVYANAITNNGTMICDGIEANGSYVNNGLQEFTNPANVPAFWEIQAGTFTNNGTLVVGGELTIAGQLDLGGAHSAIELSGTLVLNGTYTTGRLMQFLATDHIQRSGDWGIGVEGTINNTGAILNIGTGTALGGFIGAYNYSIQPQINGGVVVMHGTSTQLYANISNAKIDANGPLLDVGLGTTFSSDILTRVRTLDVGGSSFSPASFDLNGVTFTAGPATINIEEGYSLAIGPSQNSAGLTINLSNGTTLFASAGSAIQSQINVLSGHGYLYINSVANPGVLDVASSADAYATVLNNSGTIGVWGTLTNSTSAVSNAGTFANTGTISVLGNLTDVAVSTVNSGAISVGPGGYAAFEAFVGGSFENDGSISVQTGGTFASVGNSFINTGSIALAPGASFAFESYPGLLTNSGTITVGAGASFETDNLTNTGKIDVNGGVLQIYPGEFSNTGEITFEDAQLDLAGPVTVSSLTEFAVAGAKLAIVGLLDLHTGTLDIGGSAPDFSLSSNGAIESGKMIIEAGKTFLVTYQPKLYPFQALYGDVITSNLTNNGTLLFTSTLDSPTENAPLTLDKVAGSGTIILGSEGTSSVELNLTSSVGSGQTIQFIVPGSEVFLNATAEQSFNGSFAGFAAGDQIALSGDVQSAAFKGDSIVATFTNGTTLALATTSALTGSLSVLFESGPNESLLTYQLAGATLNDFAPPVSAAHPIEATGKTQAAASAWFDPHAHDLGWIPVWHGQAS